ncbi:MAG: hypothetical protein ACLQQ4_14960 [Bacteroidia bacterium]
MKYRNLSIFIILKINIPLIFTIALFLFDNTSIAQSKKDTGAAFLLSRSNQLVIGVSGGPNYTYAKPYTQTQGEMVSPEPSAVMSGINFNVTVQYKLPGKIFFSTGIIYQNLNYALNANGGYDYPLSSTTPLPPNSFNYDNYNCSISSYYISIPLCIGYFFTKNKLSSYFSLGFEFYGNYKNHAVLLDYTKNITVDNTTFYGYNRNNLYWIWGSDFVNPQYQPYGVFGILNFAESYKVTPKISASIDASLRFDNVLGINYNCPSFGTTGGISSFSLNFGLSYSFDIDNIGSFLLPDKEKDSRKTIVGFHVVPNYFSLNPLQAPLPGVSGLSLSYAFSIQFHLSNRFALETGIDIDNFRNINDVSPGVPIILKYYFHSKNENAPAYFVGIGVHMDYPNNLDYVFWGSNYAFQYITPIALIKTGGDYRMGNNYFLNVALGYGHWLNPIRLSGNENFGTPTQFVIYSSIGITYKF